MTNPPVRATPFRKPRRLTFSMMAWEFFMLRPRGRRLDGGSDALIAATAADVAGHGGVDVLLGRVLAGRQEGGGLHDLAGLAIAALRHVHDAPSLLYGV